MVMRNIREYGNIISEAMNAMVEECVTRRLDDYMGTSCFFRMSQEFPHSKWIERGHFLRIIRDDSIEHERSGREHCYFFPWCLESLCYKICYCRFSFCTSYSDDDHIFYRVSRENKCKYSSQVVIEYTKGGIKRYEVSEKIEHTVWEDSWILWKNPYYQEQIFIHTEIWNSRSKQETRIEFSERGAMRWNHQK